MAGKDPIEFSSDKLTLNADEEAEHEAALKRAEEAAQADPEQQQDPVVADRLAIFKKAAEVRDQEAAAADAEDEGEAEADEAAADGDQPQADEQSTAEEPAEQKPERVLLRINGRNQFVSVADAQRLAQQAMDAEAQRLADAGRAAREPEPETEKPKPADLKELGRRLQLGDEAEVEGALAELTEVIRAKVIEDLKPGETVTADEVDRRVRATLEAHESNRSEEVALRQDTDETMEAYPALREDEIFLRATIEDSFRERAEDLIRYAEKTPNSPFTAEEARETLRQAKLGNPQAARLIAGNHRALQKQGAQHIRSRKEVFKASAKNIAARNPNWVKGSIEDASREQSDRLDKKRKLVTQPRAAQRPLARRPGQQPSATQRATDETALRKKGVEEIMQGRGQLH